MVSFVLLLSGCLEKVTGEDIPLDPRFAAAGLTATDGSPGGGGDDQGQPQEAPPGEGGGQPGQPQQEESFSSVEGERMTIQGTVVSDLPMAVRIDLCVPDPAAQGGQRREGALQLPAGPGSFEVSVPVSVEELWLVAFQDLDSDGPSEKDPYAELKLKLDGKPPEPLELKLVAGSRGKGGDPNAGAAPPPPDGSASGQPTPPPPPEGLSFPDGPKVKLSGSIANAPANVVLDIFKADGSGGAARSFLGKNRVNGSEFVIEFPEDYGAIEIEAYQDLTGDGRTPDDIATSYAQNPITIGSDPISDVVIRFP